MVGLPRSLGLASTSLLVVAPHPDDDVLGCGALIARVAPHMPVRVVYVTDGTASHDGSLTYPPGGCATFASEKRAARSVSWA